MFSQPLQSVLFTLSNSQTRLCIKEETASLGAMIASIFSLIIFAILV